MQNYSGYGGYNPYLPQYQYQQQHQPQTNQQGYKLIPVSNRNEVNSFITDFNGTPVYFHNQATNEIYVKQFDIKTGLAKIQEFHHAESDLNHVEKENSINPYEENFKSINERLDGLYELLKPHEKEVKK